MILHLLDRPLIVSALNVFHSKNDVTADEISAIKKHGTLLSQAALLPDSRAALL